MSETDPCRLYLISPPVIDDAQAFAGALEVALSAGDVACFQLRLKDAGGTSADDETIMRVASRLLPIARSHDVVFLINDNPSLAKSAGADGVHIGQQDTPYYEAREILGPDATVGVTCHDSIDLAFAAGEAGADYVAFGAFFPTATKAAPTAADPDILTRWSAMTVVPCVAIGGVTVENCGPLVRAGADFLAVSGGVWAHPEGPAAAVAAFNKAIMTANS